MRPVQRWAILCRSDSKLDGKREHYEWTAEKPILFRTRREARQYIERVWGYLRNRPDLKAEPHGWKMPKAVRVDVILKPVGKP